MQTFLTDFDHSVTARSLDQKRLVKQLLEGRQIMEVLTKPEYYRAEDQRIRVTPWAHHPAIMMWRGSVPYLGDYLNAIADEMKRRGYETSKNMSVINAVLSKNHNGEVPWWMERQDVFANIINTHRVSLFKKDSDYYSQWSDVSGDVCCARCNYFWPSHYYESGRKYAA